MKIGPIACIVSLVLSPLWMDAPGAEKAPGELQQAANVVGEYFQTLYSNDGVGNEKTRVPDPEGASLVGRAALSDDKLALVRQEVSDLGLRQEQPFLYRGKAVTPNAHGEYPVGTSVSFTTQSRGVILVIPVVKMASGWKVDVRFWIAMRKERKENDPEYVARKFLFCLISRDENEAKELVVPGSNLRSFMAGKAPFEDQYFALAMEMPVVAAMEGEGMLMADGKAVEAQPGTQQSKWLTGLYGPLKLLFELRRVQDKWRVVPRDYLSVIAMGEIRPASQMQPTPVHVSLPPVVVKQKVAPPAAKPKPVVVSSSNKSVTRSSASGGLGIGSSIEDVRKVLGAPKGRIAMGSRAIWTYPAGTVEFRDGIVESFNGVSALSAEEAQGATPSRKSGQIPAKFTEVASTPETKIDELQDSANVVGLYFMTLGTGDKATNEKVSYPHPESAKLCARLFFPRDIDDHTITEVHEEVSGMNLTQEAPFRYRGRVIKPDSKGRYPVGTTIVFCTTHVGTRQEFSPLLYHDHNYTLIPVVKTEAGWKVDVRFWLARLNLNFRAKEITSSSPEWVISEFLEVLFDHNILALKDFTPPGSDYLSLTNNRIDPVEDDLFEPKKSGLYLAEAQAGEAMQLADGMVVVAQASTDRSKWLAGFWGRHQKLLFELRREQNGWRVVPRDYIGVIRNGNTEFDACGKLAELKMVLPPIAPKPPDIQAAVQRPTYVVMAEGEAKAALEGIMENVRTADDWAPLARHIDWVSVFLQTKLDFLKSLAIKTPDELRDFCISVQHHPSEFVRRPLKIWLPSSQPEDAPALERLEKALQGLEPSTQAKLQESFSLWKNLEFKAEELPGEGTNRVVKMTVSEGRETADINVSMVKIGRDCLIEARWLPSIIEDIADEFWKNKEISATVRELHTAARQRQSMRSGSTE